MCREVKVAMGGTKLAESTDNTGKASPHKKVLWADLQSDGLMMLLRVWWGKTTGWRSLQGTYVQLWSPVSRWIRCDIGSYNVETISLT